METKEIIIEVENIRDGSREDKLLRQAGDIIRGGGLVAFPTETVYGLGGDALNKESSQKIYEAKGRPSDNPLIVHIANWEDIFSITANLPQVAKAMADVFWPGPLTMILQKSDSVPYETTGGLETVAVRMPANQLARKIIEYSGGYVAAPSANLSGRPSPTTARHVVEDMAGRIQMIIDGGEVQIGLESTIVDLTVYPPQILRPGYITESMLTEVIGEVEVDNAILHPSSGQAPRAPGMKYRHYAPKGDLTVVEGDSDNVIQYINAKVEEAFQSKMKVGVISVCEHVDEYHADVVKSVGNRYDEKSIAKHLYKVLRDFDQEGVQIIYSEAFESNELGQAIMNRLLKAAGQKVIKV